MNPTNEECEKCPYRLHDGCNGAAEDQVACPMIHSPAETIEALKLDQTLLAAHLTSTEQELAKERRKSQALLAYVNYTEMLQAQQPSPKAVEQIVQYRAEALARYNKEIKE